MSTATIPYSMRIGPIPGVRNDISDLDGSIYDFSYIELNETDSDAGLLEAAKIYWLLESVEFTPSGTIASGQSFTKTFRYPNPYPTTYICEVFGIISGGTSSEPTTIEPVYRGDYTRKAILGQTSTPTPAKVTYFPGSVYTEDGVVYLDVRYISNRWRLYYYFVFSLVDFPYNGQLTSYDPGGASGSGNVSFLGYSLPWFSKEVDGGLFSDTNLTASSTMWTF